MVDAYAIAAIICSVISVIAATVSLYYSIKINRYRRR